MENKRLKYLAVLLFLLIVVFYVSCSLGAVKVPFNSFIVLQIRLPRVILAALVGLMLATSGAVLQGVLRNPLTDPYILGVSAGAAVGAALAFSIPAISIIYIPLFAFSGALLAVFIVYKLATVGGNVAVETLILAGVAISIFLSALLSLIIIFGNQVYPIYFWLLGGFSGATWESVWMMIPYALVGYFLTSVFSKHLNILLLGDESAQALGVDVEKVRAILLVMASLLTAAAVSVSGIIGFVGLIIPHLARLIAGGNYRLLLPISAICGAILLVLADLGARLVFAPLEIPVGIITALLGVPFFLYLLRRRRMRSR